MIMICFGFFDTYIPIGLADKMQREKLSEPRHAIGSQHDLYWEERCAISPAAPGCKIYDA
jgi:hypothetical protein